MNDEVPWLRKRPASIKAVDRFIEDGMTVGLGTGNAACMAADRLIELVDDGYDLTFVSTSDRTTAYAEDIGLEIADVECVDSIDVTIDGADEVDPDLNLIKGLGGALLREKIVAAMTEREIIVVDGFKMVENLGTTIPLPVEVCHFAHRRTAESLGKLGCRPTLRMDEGGLFTTDNGNLIYDCRFTNIDDPTYLEACMNSIPGVVECGLFIDLAYAVEAYYEADGTVEETVKGRRDGLPVFP